MQRCLFLPLIALAILALLACSQGHQQITEDSPGVDRIKQVPKAAPKRVAHGTFTLGKFQKFPFEVPPHVIAPKVRGEFSSSTPAPDGTKVSDESADVELMVMTDAQFDEFSHGRSAQSVDAIEPSHNHGVSVSLPPSQDDPVRYYVVFRRSAEGKAPISVNADITAEFDSSL